MAKPTTRRLPSLDFAFGKPDQTGQLGAGIICSSWDQHKPKDMPFEKNPTNFLKLNKKAAIDG